MSTISSKIMNLKFMQRHKKQVDQQKQVAVDAAARVEAEWTVEQRCSGMQRPAGSPAPPSGAAGSPAPPSSAGASTPHAATEATPPARRVSTVDDAQASEQQALLSFRPGRRSFGSFNPRLEKRLSEIEETKRETAAAIENERRAVEERRKAAAERADLVQKADRHEEVERQNGVSDAEMAARYAKYLPDGFNQQPAVPMPEPPVVANPVRVRDAPAGGFEGGNKAKKKKLAP
jgi:hypothetical protein